MKKHILVLYTGGTIGMTDSPEGLKPSRDLAHIADRYFPENITATWHVMAPLIDSSAITPKDWAIWQDMIVSALTDYDGILLLHGTDTMAYTAALLHYSLKGLNKPIILTGSQWPLGHCHSDAPENLIAASHIFQEDFAGVGLVFNHQLLHPSDCRKVSTHTANAFRNTHQNPMADFSISDKHWIFSSSKYKPRQETQELRFIPIKIHAKIANIFLMPGYSTTLLTKILHDNDSEGLIIQSYGNGNLPADPELLHAVEAFTAQGKPVLNISQVLEGNASDVYAQNLPIVQAGAINGGTLTPESALAKMLLALSLDLSPTDIKVFLIRDDDKD